MSLGTIRRARVVAAGLATTAALAGVHAVVPGGASAEVVQPAADCAEAFPQASVTKDLPVYGLTVSQGTTPEGFTGSVIGVIKQGIDLDTDMIMMRLDSPAIEDAGGIWAGMSGSPVYADAEHTQLIGAVAYGLTWGATPVAGVTPISAMQPYLQAPSTAPATTSPQRVSLADHPVLAKRVADAAGITTKQAEKGLTQMSTQLSISGIKSDRLAALAATDQRAVHTDLATGVMNGASSSGAPTNTLGAGGNIGAMVVYGDIDLGGIGTVTSVCDGRLIAFGHPMLDNGDTALGLMSADALYIQNDPLGVPFKVANLGRMAGTIDQDRTPAIAGALGNAPQAPAFKAAATYRGASRSGTSHAAVQDFWADGAFYQTLANSDAVLKSIIPGGSTVTYWLTGTGPAGAPFTLQHTDRYASSYDISADSAWELANLTWNLSQIEGVALTSVKATTTLDDQRQGLRIGGIQQKRNGSWVTVNASNPIVVSAGKTTALRIATRTASGAVTYVPTTLTAPLAYRGATGFLDVTGGDSLDSEPFGIDTLAGLKKYVAGLVRNDQVRDVSVLSTPSRHLRSRSLLGPLPMVVDGHRNVPVIVR